MGCDVFLGTSITLRSKNTEFNPTEDLKGGWLRDKLGLGDYDSVYAPGGFFGAVSVDEYVVYTVPQALPRYLLEFEYCRETASTTPNSSSATLIPTSGTAVLMKALPRFNVTLSLGPSSVRM